MYHHVLAWREEVRALTYSDKTFVLYRGQTTAGIVGLVRMPESDVAVKFARTLLAFFTVSSLPESQKFGQVSVIRRDKVFGMKFADEAASYELKSSLQ